MTNSPQWIEYVGRSGGRDHLGLQSVGQNIIEYLTSGFSNITQRVRYYSLYAWITKSFFNSNIDKTYKNYRLFLRKYALLYTISCGIAHSNSPGTGIDGIEYVRLNFPEDMPPENTIDIDKLLDKYKDNHWIYKAKLNDMFLTYHNDESGIPALINPYGNDLAEAFSESFRDIDVISLPASSIKVSTLLDLESKWCYHQLSDNSKELKLFEDMLFARMEDLGQKAINRRYSLVLFLMHLKEAGDLKMHNFELWLENHITFPEELNRVRNIWHILFMRNRQVYAYESIFYYFLSTCKNAFVNNSNIEQIIHLSLEKDAELDDISSFILEYWDYPLSKLIGILSNKSIQNKEWSEPWIMRSLVGMNRAERITKETKHITCGFLQLLSLYLRLNQRSFTEEEREQLNLGAKERQSLNYLVITIGEYLRLNLSVKDVVTKLLTEVILSRHQLVASEKLFDRGQDTFHYNFDEDHYVLRPIADFFEPQYNFMKLDQATHFFEDLGLIKLIEKQKPIELTIKGENIIKEFYE
jgi:hypothetical protein